MTKQDFYKLFAEKLQVANNFNEETRLDLMSEWDSWAKLEVMGMIDEKFNVNLNADDFKDLLTLGNLMSKIGEQKFE